MPNVNSRPALVVLLGVTFSACTSPETADAPSLRAPIEQAYVFAEARTLAAVDELARGNPAGFASRYPVETKATDLDLGRWVVRDVEDWRSGFFPGVLWELHRETGDPALRAHAIAWTQGIAALQDRPIDHDLGFRFVPTFGQALLVAIEGIDPAGALGALKTLERAAFALDRLFDAGGTSVGAYRAFEVSNDYLAPYPTYMDSMMNVELPLLVWDLAGKPAAGPIRDLYEHAVTHARTVLAEHVRPDGSTYHIVQHVEAPGARAGQIHAKISDQGFAAESTWSRGQAWALHGFTTTYRLTRDNPAAAELFLDAARRTADYFINHLPHHFTANPYNHVPGDFVPPTDFDAALGEPAGPWNDANRDGVLGDRRPGTHVFTPRDSSAAAVAASGLLELGTLVEDPALRARYLGAAEDILHSLLTARGPDGARLYLAVDSPHRGILARGARAYGSPQQSLAYGDHYFLEAMRRCLSLEAREGEVRRCGR